MEPAIIITILALLLISIAFYSATRAHEDVMQVHRKVAQSRQHNNLCIDCCHYSLCQGLGPYEHHGSPVCLAEAKDDLVRGGKDSEECPTCKSAREALGNGVRCEKWRMADFWISSNDIY